MTQQIRTDKQINASILYHKNRMDKLINRIVTRHNDIQHDTQDATQDDTQTLPSLYGRDGRLDITARRNAVKARMRDDGTAQDIWNSRMGAN